MSSISVRFNSFLFSYSIFNEHKCRQLADWSVWMDSNHRPHAYQACALATWATNRFTHRLSNSSIMLPFLLGPDTVGWWRWWGSNPWPPACRAGALPAELHPHVPRVAFFFFKDRWESCLSKFSQTLAFALISENWTTKVPYSLALETSLVFRLRDLREKISWSP